MKLPWNRKYFEISFYVIITISVSALLGAVCFHLLAAKNVIWETAGKILAVFAPLFWAVGIAVLFEPLTAFYERHFKKCGSGKKKKSRTPAATAAYLTAGGVLAGLCFLAVKQAGNGNLEKLAKQAGDFVLQLGDWLVLLQLRLAEKGVLQNVEGMISAAAREISFRLQGFITGVAKGLPQAGSMVLDILIGLVAAFYFLAEKESIQTFLKRMATVFFGREFTEKCREILLEIYTIIMGYLNGQITDACVMGILFAIAFHFIGIPYGIWIGVISGFSNLIPYFGAITAFFLAVLAGICSDVPMRALYAAIVILLLQQLDSAVIVPYVVGKKIELHPVLVLLSLSVFGGLFGFWGFVWAIPLGAMAKNIFFRLYRRKVYRRNKEKQES